MSELWKEDDLLLRQVNPAHLVDDKPSSQAFNPTPKDSGMLSVDDARITSPAKSYEHFTNTLGYESAGTWGISHKEISDNSDLTVTVDKQPDNAAHCLIDFNAVTSKNQRKRKAQKLAMAAESRGALYLP